MNEGNTGPGEHVPHESFAVLGTEVEVEHRSQRSFGHNMVDANCVEPYVANGSGETASPCKKFDET